MKAKPLPQQSHEYPECSRENLKILISKLQLTKQITTTQFESLWALLEGK